MSEENKNGERRLTRAFKEAVLMAIPLTVGAFIGCALLEAATGLSLTESLNNAANSILPALIGGAGGLYYGYKEYKAASPS